MLPGRRDTEGIPPMIEIFPRNRLRYSPMVYLVIGAGHIESATAKFEAR